MDLSRRQLLKAFGGAGAGITLSALGLDVREVRAATQNFKLEGAKEYTSICTFCACGCSMLCHVKDGKLINLEGDPDSIINEGALCSKGAAMAAAHESKERLTTPMLVMSTNTKPPITMKNTLPMMYSQPTMVTCCCMSFCFNWFMTGPPDPICQSRGRLNTQK